MLNMFFNKNSIMKNYSKKFHNIKNLIKNKEPVKKPALYIDYYLF